MKPSPMHDNQATHSFTRSHMHTFNIDTEGIPSSSLIQASADWGLDWMEGVRSKREMLRRAGERARGLKVGGEKGRERSLDQSMGIYLKVLVLSRYCIVKKRWLFASVVCCTALLVVYYPVHMSANCVTSYVKWISSWSFLLFAIILQVWLQRDAVQLHILSGTSRTTAGFLSLLRGFAGQWHAFRCCSFATLSQLQ